MSSITSLIEKPLGSLHSFSAPVLDINKEDVDSDTSISLTTLSDEDFDALFDKLSKKTPTSPSRAPGLGAEMNVKQSYWTPDFTVQLPALNDEQQKILDDLLEMVATNTIPKHPVIINGSGGSGKTLILAHFQRELFNRDFEAPACSYTNKAVGVLKERGIAARTIHRTLYQTRIYEEVEPVPSHPPLSEMEIKRAPTRGAITLSYQCYLHLDPSTRGKVEEIYLHDRHIYYRNPFTRADSDAIAVGVEEWYRETGGNPITEEVPRTDRHDILLMDEFSMVTKKWYEQAKKQFRHIFLFGDLMQLPPIEDDGIDLTGATYFTLERVMRTQSLQNEQHYVRKYGVFPIENTSHYCNTPTMPILDIAAKIANAPIDVSVLVWRNVTRQKINKLCNPTNTLGPDVPISVVMSSYDVHEEGEQDESMLTKNPFIADSNDWYSGSTYSKSERLVISSIRPSQHAGNLFIAEFHGHRKPAYVVLDKADFYRHRYVPFTKGSRDAFKPDGLFPIPLLWVECAYAQTCHKWQGSAVKNLIIVNEIPTGIANSWKWRYTAITRASEKCIVVNKLQN